MVMVVMLRRDGLRLASALVEASGVVLCSDWVLLSKKEKPKSKIMIIEIGEANS